MTLKLTKGDTAPALEGTVNADLTGASAVAHILRPDRTVLTKDAAIGVITPATDTSPVASAWSVTWETGDLSQVGEHRVEIEVTFAGDVIQTFAHDAQDQRAVFVVRDQIQ